MNIIFWLPRRWRDQLQLLIINWNYHISLIIWFLGLLLLANWQFDSFFIFFFFFSFGMNQFMRRSVELDIPWSLVRWRWSPRPGSVQIAKSNQNKCNSTFNSSQFHSICWGHFFECHFTEKTSYIHYNCTFKDQDQDRSWLI